MSQPVALITGVTSGIGLALKSQLESAGWKVVGFSRHLPLDDVGYEVDLSRIDSVEPVTTRAGEEHGPIDAFIHIAGVWHDADHVLAGKKLEEFSTTEILKSLHVGCTSAIIMSARIMPFMSEKSTMLYVSGKFQDGGANWLPYYTAKKSLDIFVGALAQEQTNKKVYSVAPGPVRSDALDTHFPELSAQSITPDQVASACMGLIEGQSNKESGSVVQVG